MNEKMREKKIKMMRSMLSAERFIFLALEEIKREASDIRLIEICIESIKEFLEDTENIIEEVKKDACIAENIT